MMCRACLSFTAYVPVPWSLFSEIRNYRTVPHILPVFLALMMGGVSALNFPGICRR